MKDVIKKIEDLYSSLEKKIVAYESKLQKVSKESGKIIDLKESQESVLKSLKAKEKLVDDKISVEEQLKKASDLSGQANKKIIDVEVKEKALAVKEKSIDAKIAELNEMQKVYQGKNSRMDAELIAFDARKKEIRKEVLLDELKTLNK